MGRTPLFHLLQRAARLARASLHTGAPLEEFLEHGREVRFNAGRRRLLQGAGAGLALAGCRALPNPVIDRDAEVAIVGAGIAGLTAAWRLRQQGVCGCACSRRKPGLADACSACAIPPCSRVLPAAR